MMRDYNSIRTRETGKISKIWEFKIKRNGVRTGRRQRTKISKNGSMNLLWIYSAPQEVSTLENSGGINSDSECPRDVHA